MADIWSPLVATWRTLDEAAKQLKLSRRTLQRWIAAGLLTPHKRLGDKHVWVDLDQIRKLREPKPRPRAPKQPPSEDQSSAGSMKPLAAAVIVRDGRVLLTQRRFHEFGERWSWPSGKVEGTESLEEAILRELREELLITEARIVERLGDVDLPSGYRMTHFHVAIPDSAEPKLNDYEQLTRVEWMTRAEAEAAFATLDPEIARPALAMLDRVLTTPAESQPEAVARTADGRPVMVAAIIPHPEGRPEVLMTERVRAAERVWSWVGGHVHAGETPEAAVIRELTEELEVDGPRVVRLLGKVDTHVDASPWWGRRFGRGYESYNFLVTVGSAEVGVIDHEELASAAWKPVDEVPEALAPLPPDLAEPALRFARLAIAHLAPTESQEAEERE